MLSKLEKIARKIVALPVLTLFSLGAYSNAQAQGLSEDLPFFKIQVHPRKPQLPLEEYLWFDDLRPALEYDDGTTRPEKIIVFEGDYYGDGIGIENKWVEGYRSPIPTISISNRELAGPQYRATVHFRISFLGNNTFKNIDWRPSGKNAGILQFDNNLIENCYIDGSDANWSVILGGGNQYLRNNIFRNFNNSYAVAVGGRVTDIPILRNNVFFENDIAIGYSESTRINLGEITATTRDDGMNVFIRNRKNMRILTGRFTPAQGNYWYDERGNLLTREKDILKTIELVNPEGQTQPLTAVQQLMSYLETINVVPYQTEEHPLFPLPKTAVRNWLLYE